MKYLVAWSLLVSALALGQTTPPAQADYERELSAVVRNKIYFKSGKFEISPVAGTMPYDSLVNHYMLGGRLSWHLGDHYGWEVLDALISFPNVTKYTTDLVSQKGISNLQTTELKWLAATGFLFSPLYGKVRFFGSTVLYLDLYAVVGVGMAKTNKLTYSASGENQPANLVATTPATDPLIHFGLGFKVFMNRAMGLTVDLRDYLVYTETYGKKHFKSNFAVTVGVAFFLPIF